MNTDQLIAKLDELIAATRSAAIPANMRWLSAESMAAHGYYLAQIRPAGCRKWRTIKGARGDRKFRSVSKAVIAAAKSMKKGLRARVIFCADWHEPMVAWEARWT